MKPIKSLMFLNVAALTLYIALAGCRGRAPLEESALAGGGVISGGGDGSRLEVECLGSVAKDKVLTFSHAIAPWPAMGGNPPTQATLHQFTSGSLDWMINSNPSRHIINRKMRGRDVISGQYVYENGTDAKAFKVEVNVDKMATEGEVTAAWRNFSSRTTPDVSRTQVFKGTVNYPANNLKNQPIFCVFYPPYLQN